MTRPRFTPDTIRDMARRRGLAINKAKRGGWYVTLAGAPWHGVLYAAHTWPMIFRFVKAQPRIIKRGGSNETE